jgi:ethanolamine utilization protein EutN
MEIFQVEGPLVCTQRIEGLRHSSLRVLKSASGKLQVAVDPVGVRPGNWVFTASGSAARYAAESFDVLTDLTVCGIIDYWPPPEDEPDPATARAAASS